MRKPEEITAIEKGYSFSERYWFTFTNPKVAKNGKVHSIPTAVWHGHPVLHGACPNAGACKRVCLNRSGNPLYLKGKIPCRVRRSNALYFDPYAALQYHIWQTLRFVSKHWDNNLVLGVRNNGTTDHAWESAAFNVRVSPAVADYIAWTTGFELTDGLQGQANILAIIRTARRLRSPHHYVSHKLRFYDYTKRVDRDVTLCRLYQYHLTASHGSTADTFQFAQRYGLNYAAAFDVRRSQPLPEVVNFGGVDCKVIDGDVSDWRPFDPLPNSGEPPYIVGLRIKRTPGQTAAQRAAFCLPVTSS